MKIACQVVLALSAATNSINYQSSAQSDRGLCLKMMTFHRIQARAKTRIDIKHSLYQLTRVLFKDSPKMSLMSLTVLRINLEMIHKMMFCLRLTLICLNRSQELIVVVKITMKTNINTDHSSNQKELWASNRASTVKSSK